MRILSSWSSSLPPKSATDHNYQFGFASSFADSEPWWSRMLTTVALLLVTSSVLGTAAAQSPSPNDPPTKQIRTILLPTVPPDEVGVVRQSTFDGTQIALKSVLALLGVHRGSRTVGTTNGGRGGTFEEWRPVWTLDSVGTTQQLLCVLFGQCSECAAAGATGAAATTATSGTDCLSASRWVRWFTIRVVTRVIFYTYHKRIFCIIFFGVYFEKKRIYFLCICYDQMIFQTVVTKFLVKLIRIWTILEAL